MATGMVWEKWLRATSDPQVCVREGTTEPSMAFETSKPIPKDTFPFDKTTPPNPSNPIKDFYSLVTEHSDI